jgi:hypothetical protein
MDTLKRTAVIGTFIGVLITFALPSLGRGQLKVLGVGPMHSGDAVHRRGGKKNKGHLAIGTPCMKLTRPGRQLRYALRKLATVDRLIGV